MAKKTGSNTPNTSNQRNILPVIKNQNLSQYNDDLFSALKTIEPQKSWEELVNDLEHDFTITNWQGLLSRLTAKGHQISFWLLADEEFSLEELERLNLGENPFVWDTDPLKLWLEKVLVEYIKTQFIAWLPAKIKSNFSARVRYYTNSLSELLSAIQLFPDQINDPEQKKKYTDFVAQFRITFHNLKTALETSTPPIALDELNSKSFNDWTESQQKTFDTLFTKTVLERLRGRVQMMKNLTKSTAELFSKPLFPSSIISKKYPIDYEELYQKAHTDYPDIAQQIADLEDQIVQGGDSDALGKQIEACYRKIYLEELKTKDANLAEILQLLHDHKFDYAVLNQDPALRSAFFDFLIETKVEQMEDEHTLELFGNDSDQLKDFLKQLVDFSSDTLNVNGYTFKIERELLDGANLALDSLWEFANNKELPLKITLSGVNTAGLWVADRELFDHLFVADAEVNGQPWTYDKVELKGEKIGKLLVLLKMGAVNLQDSLDPESEPAKKRKKFQEDLQKQHEITKNTRKLHKKGTSEDASEDVDEEESKNTTPEEKRKAFLEAWKGMRGEKSEASDAGFVVGAERYFTHTESSLPPYTNGANAWKKFRITDIDRVNGTFKAKCYGTELKLWFWEEGKEFDFHFEDFENFFINNDKLLEKPFKMLPWTHDLKATYDKMLEGGVCSENLFRDAQFEDGKLKLTELNTEGKEITEEVKYFGHDGDGDPKKAVLYETKWNSDHTVTVKSTNFLNKEGEARYHEKKMSYPDFLIFLQEKQLTPKTAAIAEREKQKIDDIHSSQHRKLKRVSIHSLVFSVKNIWKKINDGVSDYQKAQDEACLDWLTGDVGIYNLLNKGLWWLAPALSDTLTALQDGVVAEKEKKNWGSIEHRLKIFKGVEFPDIFSSGKDPATGQRLRQLDACLPKGKTLKDILISRQCVINNGALRPIMAAAMIANLKQGKGLYRGMSEYDNQALWVQCLLGPKHYQRYLEYRKKIQADIDSGAGDADQLRDLLVKSEVNYIVWNIQNAHGNDKYFGSVKDKNRQALKKIYSNEFANQLNSAAEEITGHGAVEWAYGKYKKMNTFNVVEEEFKKNITSSRIESGLGALKRMGELAKTKQQRQVLEAAMSYITMTGILNKYAGKETMTWFDGLARSLMLPTAFFADKPFHQHYAWHVLDQVPVQPRFSEAMKEENLTESRFSKNSAEVPYKAFLGILLKWRSNNADTIDDYFLSLKTKEHKNDPILNKVKEVLWEKNPDNLDPSWRSKPKLTGHFGLNQTPAVIEQNKSYGKSGFDGKDEDERNDKATFWKELKANLEKAESDPEVKPEFFLKQFKTWFRRDGFADANDVENISMLRTIAKASKDVWKESITFEDGEYNIEFKVKAHTQKDVKNLIWYLFEGKVLKQGSCQPPVEFKKVLDFFVDYFTKHLGEICSDEVMKKVFDTGALEADDAKAGSFVNWKEYNSVIGKDDNVFAPPTEELDSTQKSKDAKQEEKRIKAWKKRYYRQDPFINRGLVDMEKHLRRINVAPPKLLSAGAGHITSS